MIHRTLRAFSLVACSFILFCACKSARTSQTNSDPELERFASLLIGKFSSQDQAKRDTDYYNISLKMTRIWEEKKDGIWLYVEQALASRMNKPYRQRVYKLGHPSAQVFSSEIYTIENAQQVIGLDDTASKRSLITPDKISLKDGCTVILKLNDGTYEGGTQGNNCPSDLRGAKYATTKIKLRDGVLESWDQGFDTSGKQVWGATKGGYVFIKEK